ncbi:tetratricopeptide repeat protein [Hydromonas duriensis]|uniref:Uncharacterized protein n=1 Tax=Hydromonas duriensis TaxID=1527608 RepID=A0A4R6Y9S0_9BURK|nr:tetratricopeptide repeat protein [Hydromonas duriensis]TDR32211.1 hypothetical protein DFR44_10598 [Hydromonas duriensis]
MNQQSLTQEQIETIFRDIQLDSKNNQHDSVLQKCDFLLQFLPTAHGIHYYKALALSMKGMNDLAYDIQLIGLQYDPDNAAYHFNAATYAQEKNDVLRSMMHYQRSLHIKPDYQEALWNYSEQLRLDGHIEMAIDCLHRLIELGEDHYDKFYNRLVACYALLDEYQERAHALYKKLLQDPTDDVARWGYALDELRQEHFDTGFTYYNRRFESSYLNNAYCYNFPYPLLGEKIKKGQVIVVHGEQGLGDEMMFMSPMNELLAEAKAAQAKVIIACKPSLVRLFASSFPETRVFAHTYREPSQDIAQLKVDAHLPMGHLLQRYRKSLADFDNNRHAYFVADSQRTAYFDQRIKIQGRESKDGKRRLRVGLMWGTVSSETVQRFERAASKKSIPLPLFKPFIDLVDDIEFVSLQNKDRGSEAALLPELQMIDFSLEQDDFYDTAAIIKNLDIVVCVCTSVSHLAGGMEAETWVPLIKNPDWRHGLPTRDTSYWYNNTRYFRQTQTDQWSDVIDNLATALRERAAQFKS